MKISIEFNKQNITHLLKSTFIYSFMTNGAKPAEDEDKSVNSYEQMILGLLYNSGIKEVIEFHEETNIYYIKNNYEDSILEIIKEHNHSRFWNDLVVKLSTRDYFLQKGRNEDSSDEDDSDHEEKNKIVVKLEEKYWDEFKKYGIDNLKIAK